MICSLVILYQELLGLEKIEVVQNDGSPCGDKLFIFWNPPSRVAPVGHLITIYLCFWTVIRDCHITLSLVGKILQIPLPVLRSLPLRMSVNNVQGEDALQYLTYVLVYRRS